MQLRRFTMKHLMSCTKGRNLTEVIIFQWIYKGMNEKRI